MSGKTCKFFNTGFCKFGETCRFKNAKENCVELGKSVPYR